MTTKYATANEFTLFGLPMEALDGVSFDVESHLEVASALFESYARGRYSLPLVAPYPLEVKQAVCVIAAYNIVQVRGYDPENGTDRSIRARYEDTLAGRPGMKSSRPGAVAKESATVSCEGCG